MDPKTVADEAKEAAKEAAKKTMVKVHNSGEFANLLDSDKFAHMWRLAELFSRSDMVPDHFKNKPANCFIGVEMAVRLQMHPFMLLQNMYVVHGRPGVQAQLLIALANERGPFTGPIQYEMSGKGMEQKCRAYATHKATGQVCEYTLNMETVHAENWDLDKTNRDTGKVTKSKWNTMRDLMFHYRSATMLIRVFCPEVLMGLRPVDELDDWQEDEKPAAAPAVTINKVVGPDPTEDVPDFPVPKDTKREVVTDPMPSAEPEKPKTVTLLCLADLNTRAAACGIPSDTLADYMIELGITQDKRTHSTERLKRYDAWVTGMEEGAAK